jgi:hypothetical protein
MIRRRHRVREIPFSFDSFLDVVANVVGIIIRLILVVWVGARSYSSLQPNPKGPSSATDTAAESAAPEDPLQAELARHRRELAETQARLLEQLRQFQQVQQTHQLSERQLASLKTHQQALEQQGTVLTKAATEGGRVVQAAVLSLEELRRRRDRVQKELDALEKLPPLTQTLRYRTPVSRPVHSEELRFECRRGRVTFLDLNALMAEIQGRREDLINALHSQWQVSDVVGPVGAFQLRYSVERQRETLDAVMPGSAPESHANFRAEVSELEVEPVEENRGEPLAQALAAGSEFRRLTDTLDPQQTVVTFWVYPDSFATYRRLRDYLYERDVEVAGQPLPEGVPIRFSPRGRLSRGQ